MPFGREAKTHQPNWVENSAYYHEGPMLVTFPYACLKRPSSKGTRTPLLRVTVTLCQQSQ